MKKSKILTKKEIYLSLILCLLSFFSFNLKAQEICDASVPVIVVDAGNCDGVSTNGDNTNAIDEGNIAGTCFAGSNFDVWFQFTAPTTGELIISTDFVGGTLFDTEVAIYSDCVGTQIACSQDEGIVDPGNGSTWLSVTEIAVTAGATYYIQVSGYNGQTGSFCLAVNTPPPPPAAPANDECVDAISLVLNTDLECGITLAGTIGGATDSNANDCFGTSDDDVWYSFVATQSSHQIELNNITNGTVDLYIAVWDGCPGTGSAIHCSDPQQTVAPNLVAGQIYYIQVYSWTGTADQTSNYDLCVGTPPPPPFNDNCGDAPIAQVNTDGTCAQVIQGTTESANGATEIGSCDFGGDADVFYRFVAPPGGGLIVTQIAAAANLEMTVFDACGGTEVPGTCISESLDGGQNVVGLTPGVEYILILWNDDGEPTGPFEVCLQELNACALEDINIEENLTFCNGDTPIEVVGTNLNNENVTFSNGTIDPSTLVEGETFLTLSSNATTLCPAGTTFDVTLNVTSSIAELADTFCIGEAAQTVTIPEGSPIGINILFLTNGSYDGEIALGLYAGTYDTLNLPPSGSGLLGTIDETEIEAFGTTGDLTSPDDLYSPAVDNSPGFIALAPGDYTIYLGDSYGDGWNGTTFLVTDYLGNFITNEQPINDITGDINDELNFVNFTIPDFTTTVTGTGVTTNSDNTFTFDPAVGVGSYTVTLTLANCIVNQEVAVVTCVNTNDIDDAFEIDVFPNPYTDVFTVQIQNENSNDDFSLVVYDNFGRIIEHFEIENGQGTIEIGAAYSSGIYFIRAETEDGVSITKRITKI